MRNIFLSIVLIAFAADLAVAAAEITTPTTPITFRAPMGFAGTGCPAGSINVTGANNSTQRIFFDRYDAGQGMNSVSKMPRTACSFSIPIQVPGGFQISEVTVDWRGFAQGRVQLNREYFIAGHKGPKKTTSPSGNYRERDIVNMVSWSPCSDRPRQITMRINSSIQAVGNPSYISLSHDVEGRRLNLPTILSLEVQRCR